MWTLIISEIKRQERHANCRAFQKLFKSYIIHANSKADTLYYRPALCSRPPKPNYYQDQSGSKLRQAQDFEGLRQVESRAGQDQDPNSTSPTSLLKEIHEIQNSSFPSVLCIECVASGFLSTLIRCRMFQIIIYYSEIHSCGLGWK